MKKLFTILLIALTTLSLNAGGGLVVQYTTATSGTVTCQDTGQDVLIIHDAGATVTLTIAMPATPYNGQCITLSSTGGITTLSLTTGVGSLTNAITTMATGGTASYTYYTAQTKWYKTQ